MLSKFFRFILSKTRSLKIFVLKIQVILKSLVKYLSLRRYVGLKHKQSFNDDCDYPYRIYHSYDVLTPTEKTNYERFLLVGDNWKADKNKPIAVIFGCNDWKYGFIADYLKEYRCAFSRRHLNGLMAVIAILRLRIKPSKFFIWGYNDRRLLSLFFSFNDVVRIEDGFVRSVDLGASHSTPYSLVFDSKGLYYNCNKESQIEHLLNNHDFSNDTGLLEKAEYTLGILNKLKISKYNPVVFSKNDAFSVRRKVLVIGQIDSDASLKYGNPDRYTSDQVVVLAKQENPDADIIYRPHPEIYEGYKKSKIDLDFIKSFAYVVSPKTHIADFIEGFDHVYTITSLSGLEALLRGKKVTVLGAPFYAGWGLTDDRVNILRRNRTLSILELFALTYLVYPRYLADKDNYVGLLSACLSIYSQKESKYYDLFHFKSKDDPSVVLETKYYFIKLLFLSDTKLISDNFNKISFDTYLKESLNTPLFQKLYLIMIIGKLKNDRLEDNFLTKIRLTVNLEAYHYILLFLKNFTGKQYLTKHCLWLMKQTIDFDIDEKLINLANSFEKEYLNDDKSNEIDDVNEYLTQSFDLADIKSSLQKFIDDKDYEQFHNLINFINDDMNNGILESKYRQLNKEIAFKDLLYDVYMYYRDKKNFSKALKLAELLLLNDINVRSVIFDLVELSALTFNFEAAKCFSKLNINIDLYFKNKNICPANINLYSKKDVEKQSNILFYCDLLKLIIIKNSNIMLTPSFLGKSKNSNHNLLNKVFASVLYLDNDQTVEKAQAFLSTGKTQTAINIIDNLVIERDYRFDDKMCMVYTKALFLGENRAKAVKFLSQYIFSTNSYNVVLYHELILCYVELGFFKRAESILDLAESKGIEITKPFKFKVYQALKQVGQAYSYYKDFDSTLNFAGFFNQKYTNTVKDVNKNDTVAIFACYGPGDEIRFASFYNKFIQNIDCEKIYISTSGKLLNLFKRSFPKVEFVEVNRLRNMYDAIDAPEEYNKMPSLELATYLDNTAMKIIAKSSKISLATDFMADLIQDYSSFDGKSYLLDDQIRTVYYKDLLPRDTILVGINWRSSLSGYTRNTHYLSVEELEPIFSIKNITFVNLQYDECEEELSWIDKRYPGKMINIKELDQFNDLDGVASLIKCLDLVIAPCTSVGELAGALGCNTWIFSNSYEIRWRQINAKSRDVWHESLTIVDNPEIGNKKELVLALTEKLEDFALECFA